MLIVIRTVVQGQLCLIYLGKFEARTCNLVIWQERKSDTLPLVKLTGEIS